MKTETVRLRSEDNRELRVAPDAHCEFEEAVQPGVQKEAGRQVLPASLEEFILHRKIDSFCKLWFLLLLHQHSKADRIDREYVRRVTFTDAPTLDEAIDELQDVGLLTATGEALHLRDTPEVRSDLDTMARVFEDPTDRQELLRRLYRHAGVPLQAALPE